MTKFSTNFVSKWGLGKIFWDMEVWELNNAGIQKDAQIANSTLQVVGTKSLSFLNDLD